MIDLNTTLIVAYCVVRGDDFHPSRLLNLPDIHFNGRHDPGELRTKGPRKGQPFSRGNCYLEPPPDFTGDKISWVADFIARNKAMLRKAGGTQILMWIDWYGIQGNMEYTVEQLQKLAAMGVPLAVDYIYQKPDQEPFS
ncbi:MAG: hypothetical protein AAGA31_08090 [Bacteroidota bacterium]